MGTLDPPPFDDMPPGCEERESIPAGPFGGLLELTAQLCGASLCVAVVAGAGGCRVVAAAGSEAGFDIGPLAGAAMAQGGVLEIPDLGPGCGRWRHFAGCAVGGTEGAAPGALCVFGEQARRLTEVERRVLMVHAAQLSGRLPGSQRLGLMDPYQLLFDSHPLPMWVYDVQTLEFLAVNQAAVEKYRFTRQEFLSLTIRDIRPAEDVAALERNVRATREGRESSGPWRHQTRDGKLLTVEIYSHSLQFAGRAARLVLPLDISERVESEEHLRQAHKMETIGRLAGGIAHEFNNLLTVINGYTQMLLHRMASDESVALTLRHVMQAGERAAGLTAQLLAFSRRQVLEPRTAAINALVESMRPMLDQLIREDIEIRWRLDPEAGMVSLDPAQFEQVVLNLAVNARDAMPEGGSLTLATSVERLAEGDRRLGAATEPGEFAVLTVADTGHGIAPEMLGQIFEPFFTTKSRRRGAGLGLATAYGIVHQSGGMLLVESEPGSGSRFSVYLPRLAAPERVPEPAGTGVAAPGEATVLLVEDNEPVRAFAAKVLRGAGYRVLEAADGPEAVSLAEHHLQPIQLLITDILLPGIHGRDLAGFLTARRPGMSVLFASGYAEAGERSANRAGDRVLSKPFTAAGLLEAVSVAMAAPSRAVSVLVVDDDPAIRMVLRESLEADGYETMVCADGRAAIEALAERTVDVLITDIVMPRQEGMETIRQTRRRFPQVKILAISGFGGGEYLRVARTLGANETMAKPIAAEALRTAVARLAGRE